MKLNNHNINAGYEAVLEAYRKRNQDLASLYHVLETVKHRGFIHDATSHSVKEFKTMFVRAVDDIWEGPINNETGAKIT